MKLEIDIESKLMVNHNNIEDYAHKIVDSMHEVEINTEVSDVTKFEEELFENIETLYHSMIEIKYLKDLLEDKEVLDMVQNKTVL